MWAQLNEEYEGSVVNMAQVNCAVNGGARVQYLFRPPIIHAVIPCTWLIMQTSALRTRSTDIRR